MPFFISKDIFNVISIANTAVITNKDDMISVIARDHVCAEFKKAHRSIDDFLSSDVEVMDCDNDHSDNPKDWITPEKYEELFPDVSYIIVPRILWMRES